MKVNEKELYFEKITGAHIKRKLNKNKIHEYALMSYKATVYKLSYVDTQSLNKTLRMVSYYGFFNFKTMKIEREGITFSQIGVAPFSSFIPLSDIFSTKKASIYEEVKVWKILW